MTNQPKNPSSTPYTDALQADEWQQAVKDYYQDHLNRRPTQAEMLIAHRDRNLIQNPPKPKRKRRRSRSGRSGKAGRNWSAASVLSTPSIIGQAMAEQVERINTNQLRTD